MAHLCNLKQLTCTDNIAYLLILLHPVGSYCRTNTFTNEFQNYDTNKKIQGFLIDSASVATFNATAAFERTSASVVYRTSSRLRQPSHLNSQKQYTISQKMLPLDTII